MSEPTGGLSPEAIQQLEDALKLTPTERLRLMESLWEFAKKSPHYTPKEPDQLRHRDSSLRSE